MLKKINSFLILLTALLCFGAGTAWADEELVFSDGFEGTLSDNWTKVSCHSSSIPYSTAKRTGSKGFRFYYNTNPPQYLISKALSVPSGATSVSLSFYYKAYSSSYEESFAVGYSTTDNSTSSFTWDTEIKTKSTSWTQYVNNNLPVGTKYICIKYTANDKYYLFIDDLEMTCTVTSTCPKPKNLIAGFVGDKNASFSWAKGADESSWQYVYLPTETALTDEAWSGETAGSVNTTSVSLSGLSVSTDYVLYLRADCGSEQSAEISKAFTTACEAKAVPFNENFNNAASTNYAIPDCWSRIAYVSGTSYYPYVNSSQGVESSKGLYFYGGSSTTSSIIILPLLDAPTNTLAISFDYKQTQTNANYGQAKIGYITDPKDASTFQVIKALGRESNWTAVEEELLTGAPANSYIAIQFAGTGSSNCYMSIDNIEVTVPTACKKPGNLTVGAISPTSLKASWTAKGEETAWNVRFSMDGENWTTRAADTNPFVITGLTASTTYEVQVQANCGGEQSNWTASKSAATLCAPVEGIGFSQNFDSEAYSSGNIPSCWSKINSGNYPQVYNYYAKGCSGKCLEFYGGVTDASEQIAILPPFSEATNTLLISLYYSNSQEECNGWNDYATSAYGLLEIGFITDPTDASTFTAQETLARVSVYTQAQVALTNAPAGSYVALRYAGGSSIGEVYVDDIEISAIPSCIAPSNVNGAATAYNQASISWTENGSATAWQVRYSPNNGDSWSDAVAANTNPFTLTGLSANTDYIVQVKALCGGEDVSSWSGSSAPIHTPCGAVDASDYNENFESAAAGVGKLPDCWQYKEKYSTGYPYVYNYAYYAYAGNQSLYFYGGIDGSSEQSVLLPAMDEALNGLTLEFYYKDADYDDNAKFTVGYIAANGTDFVPVETLAYAENYTKYTKDLASVPADAKCLAIRYAGGVSTTGYGYIDNVHVYPTPTCAAPTGVTVSDVTATTAQVAWTENNSATAWKLQISNDGSSWGDAISVDANPYQLTGLTPNHTTYYVRVNSVCGGTDPSPYSAASAPFQTECETRSMPFSENFNNLTEGIPTCWDNSEGTTATESYKWNYYATGHEGKGVRFDSYYNSKYNTNTLKTPAITISEAAMLDFWYKNPDGGDLSIYYSIDGVKQDAPLASGLTGKSEWTQASFNLPNACVGHDVVIMFQGTSNYGNGDAYIYLDDVQVIEQPACPAVNATTLAVSDVTANSATVAWTAASEETAWNLQYKAEGGEWSSVIPVATTPSYALSGLAANTLYYVKVQANCGGDGTSEWTGDDTFSFRTDCEAIAVSKASPWECNFDNAENGKMPTCWERVEPYDSYGWPYVDEYAYYAQSGAKYLYFKTPGRSGSSYTEDAILPVFNTEIKNLKVSFSYFNGAATSNYGQLAIGYVVGDAFTQVGELLAQVEDYTLVEREMPNDAPDGARIAIRCIGSTKGSTYTTTAYLDDIQVSLKPTCYTPTNLQAAETSDGASLSWTAGKDENEWSVRYSVKDADEWTVVDDEITATNYTLTGLSQNVTYEVQVKAVCGVGDESEWSASVEFAPACNAPTALAVTARTNNSATFSWISNETAWVLQYTSDGETWESENVAANPFTLNDLAAGTTYQAKIQAACGSDFSNVVEFTTVCAMRAASELPLNEDFTGIADDALPACWESATAHVESEKLFFRGTDEQIVVLPGYDINLNKLYVSFDYTLNNAKMQFGYVSAIGGAFNSLANLEGTSYAAALSTETVGYLAFRYYETTSEWAAATIDNVHVARLEVFSDSEDTNQDRLAALKTAGTIDVIINRNFPMTGDYNTLCLPFSLSAAQLADAECPLNNFKLKVFDYATVLNQGTEDEEVQLAIAPASSIEAGVPYFVAYLGESTTAQTSMLFKNVVIEASEPDYKLDNGVKYTGVFNPATLEKDNEDLLFLAAGNKLYWPSANNDKIVNGFRCYFNTNAGASSAPVRRGVRVSLVERAAMPTGIENTNVENITLKFIENGQVIIIRNGVKYNIQGQVISK